MHVLVGLDGRAQQPESGADGHVAEAAAAGDAFGEVIDAPGVHDGRAGGEGPAAVQAIAEGDIEQVNQVLLIHAEQHALGLLEVADEGPEGVLPAIADADGPAAGSGRAGEDAAESGGRSSAVGRFATTQGAEHGRSLPCGHSTLAVGLLSMRGEEGREQKNDDGGDAGRPRAERGWMDMTRVVFLLVSAAAVALAADSRPVNLPFKDVTGRKVRVSDHRGKFVVLNFWATWCLPCREELPLLAAAEKTYGARGVVFVAASLDDVETRPRIPETLKQLGVGFTAWTGASTLDLEDLKLGEALPATVFLDREGRVVFRVLGAMTKQELDERLEWLTGDRSGPAPSARVTHLAPRQ